MLSDHWPLTALRLHTPDLELGWPTDEELALLADVAAGGVHDPSFMPFYVPWTDASPKERARSVILHYWNRAGSFTVQAWRIGFVVFLDGRPIGVQNIHAEDFTVTREVHTGSWLGQRFHGRGYGTQMRAAVLAFAFAGLGAETARSGAYVDNHASLGVSRKLGYHDDGLNRRVVRGRLQVEQRLRIDRADWACPIPVEISAAGMRRTPLVPAERSPVPPNVLEIFGL